MRFVLPDGITGHFNFETSSLQNHIAYFLHLLHAANEKGHIITKTEVKITAFNSHRESILQTGVIDKLKALFPDAIIRLAPERESGRGYYQEAGFQIDAYNASNEYFFLADGGFTDWTQQFLGNRKERLLISGLGQ